MALPAWKYTSVGPIVSIVKNFTDLAVAVREKLKAKILKALTIAR